MKNYFIVHVVCGLLNVGTLAGMDAARPKSNVTAAQMTNAYITAFSFGPLTSGYIIGRIVNRKKK